MYFAFVALFFETIVIFTSATHQTPPTTYIKLGNSQEVLLTYINPVLLCLDKEHVFTSILRAFQKQSFWVNSISFSNRAYPILIYPAISEADMYNQAVWINARTLYQSFDPSTVIQSEKPSKFPQSVEFTKDDNISLSGLHYHCMTMLPSEEHRMNYHHMFKVEFKSELDFFRIFRLACGLVLYFIAPYICQNIFFYYLSGVSMSVVGSFLLLLILTLKLLPKRSSFVFQGLLILSGGAFSIVYFCLNYLQTTLINFARQNVGLLIGYILIVSIMSTLLFYWFSVPETLLARFPRTQTILKLLLRLVAVFLITSAPQLPDEISYFKSMTVYFHSFVNQHLGYEYSTHLSFLAPHSSVLHRFLLAICIATSLYIISMLLKPTTQDYVKYNKQFLPPIPCAASSPAPGCATTSWQTYLPMTGFHNGVVASDYNGYLTNKSATHFENYVYSPVVARNQGRLSFYMKPIPYSPKTSTGKIIHQTNDILTDDEED